MVLSKEEGDTSWTLEIKKGITPIFVISEISVVFHREFQGPSAGDIYEAKILPDVKIFSFKNSPGHNSTVQTLI